MQSITDGMFEGMQPRLSMATLVSMMEVSSDFKVQQLEIRGLLLQHHWQKCSSNALSSFISIVKIYEEKLNKIYYLY